MPRKRRPAKRESENQNLAPPESLAAMPESGSFWENLQALKEGAVQLHLCLLGVVSFLQPLAVGWFDDGQALPSEPWAFYATVLKRTAPLTIGLVIWFCLLVALSTEGADGGLLMFMMFLGGIILTVAAHVGNALGAAHVEVAEYFQSLGPLTGIANALLGYLQAYRGALFVSSLGIAAYAGCVMYRVVHFVPASKLSAPEASQAEEDRRAA